MLKERLFIYSRSLTNKYMCLEISAKIKLLKKILALLGNHFRHYFVSNTFLETRISTLAALHKLLMFSFFLICHQTI